jgi:hypothetical protein
VLKSRPAPSAVFSTAQTTDLPVAVRNWLRHNPTDYAGVGFIWAATVHIVGMPVLGYDKYLGGIGEMHCCLGGLNRSSQHNADIRTCAAGRLSTDQ